MREVGENATILLNNSLIVDACRWASSELGRFIRCAIERFALAPKIVAFHRFGLAPIFRIRRLVMIANKLGIPHYAKPFALAAAATLFATVAMGDYLGKTGGYVTTTAQPAFQNVSLSEIGNAYLIKARMAGAWINAEVRGNPAYVANFKIGRAHV